MRLPTKHFIAEFLYGYLNEKPSKEMVDKTHDYVRWKIPQEYDSLVSDMIVEFITGEDQR